tara:strand:- start:828 stop:1112 length:285 start_codon:yes stop_codon:yes gene_type:complete
MKPSVQENVQQLQTLVSLVVKMIQDDLSNSTSICSQDSMTLGDFKERVKMSEKESIRIKNECSSVALTLIELDLCERAIKSVNPRATVIIKEEK